MLSICSYTAADTQSSLLPRCLKFCKGPLLLPCASNDTCLSLAGHLSGSVIQSGRVCSTLPRARRHQNPPGLWGGVSCTGLQPLLCLLVQGCVPRGGEGIDERSRLATTRRKLCVCTQIDQIDQAEWEGGNTF